MGLISQGEPLQTPFCSDMRAALSPLASYQNITSHLGQVIMKTEPEDGPARVCVARNSFPNAHATNNRTMGTDPLDSAKRCQL